MYSLCSSRAGGRLKWTLPAPLKSAISVLANDRAPNGPSEPYFRQTLSGGTWHPVSEEPISEPPQPSITVKVFELATWGDQWEEYHEHADRGDPDCVFAPSDDEGPGELLRCCGEQRPEPPQPLVITATKKYVTVHDYVSAVHAWLMEHFDDISSAVNIWNGGEPPPDQKLVVDCSDLRSLSILEENIWCRVTQPVPSLGAMPHMPQPYMGRPMMSPENVRRLNEQLRQEGSDLQYDEYQ